MSIHGLAAEKDAAENEPSEVAMKSHGLGAMQVAESRRKDDPVLASGRSRCVAGPSEA